MIKISFQSILEQNPSGELFAKTLYCNRLIDDSQFRELRRRRCFNRADFPGLTGHRWPLVRVMRFVQTPEALWLLRCIPEHNSLWHKLAESYRMDALELGSSHEREKRTPAESARAEHYFSVWAAKRASDSEEARIKKKQTARLRSILYAGEWTGTYRVGLTDRA